MPPNASESNTIRAFIALEIPEPLRAPLRALDSELQRELSGTPLRWPPVENIHLTLKFLGDVYQEDVKGIEQTLKTEARVTPTFEVSLGEMGAFPNLGRPRVVWLGVGGSPDLADLQRRIEAGCERLGFPPERRPFSPHLTLARVKRGANRRDLERISQAIEERQNVRLGAAPVGEIILFRSQLSPQGARYSRLFGVQCGASFEETESTENH
jgi:2'-5' RNA ligase